MRKLVFSYFVSICFARLFFPFLSRQSPSVHAPRQAVPLSPLIPQPSPLGGIFNWLFGMGATFKVQFDLLGPVDSKQMTLPEDKVTQLVADLAKTDKGKVKTHIDGWFKIDITLVARKENIDVIEKAVAEGVFLKDLLGNLKEFKDDKPGRRNLRHHHELKGQLTKPRRHELRHHHGQILEAAAEQATSNLKISKRRRVDIPGHGEADKTYVEISLPTKCDCFHEASEASLVDIVSHITALHRSQVKVQTRPSWRIYAMFNEPQAKMAEIQHFYFSGQFEKQLNSKLHEYHILDNTPTASTKETPELSVAGPQVYEAESLEGEAPSFLWSILGGGVLTICLLGVGFKLYVEHRKSHELDLAFLPSENVEILEEDQF